MNKGLKVFVGLFMALLIVFISTSGIAAISIERVSSVFVGISGIVATGEERLSLDLGNLQEEIFNEVTMSENRRKYLELLENSYSNHQLRQRFRELFGDGYSGEYIFHNYRTIFDLKDDEVINSAFLRALSGYRVDLRFQNTDIHSLGRSAFNDGRVLVFSDSDIRETPPELEELFWKQVSADRPEPEIINHSEVFDLQIDANIQAIEVFSNNLTSINLVSRTDTTITVNMWFADSSSPNNALQISDPGTGGWRWVLGQGQPAANTGTHTVTNLSPGVTYILIAWAWDITRQVWVEDRIFVTTTAPPSNLVLHSRSSVDFRLDRLFTDTLEPVLTNRFLDATNQAFYSIRTLIGGPQFYSGGKMQIDHVRNLPRYTEGWSGWPIQWQLFGVHNDRLRYSLDHAQRMRATNIETTEIPIHEIGHNFDNWRWSFDTEVFAMLFTYYYYATTGRSMANANDSRTFTGSEFRTYMRSYAYRGLGQINHDEAMRRGVYSPYSLAWRLGEIANEIGWQPFTDTFIYFHRLSINQVPQEPIDKLNLFLTKLRDFSGTGVIAMIPANEIRIYERHFGRTTIQYVALPTTTFTITYQIHENHAHNTTGSLPQRENPREIGLSFTIADNRGNLHRPGYILIGWSTRNNLTRDVPDFRAGQRDVVINTPGNVTLYAHWQPIGWTNPVSVNVSLYHDKLFDIYADVTAHRQELHDITTNAARSFDRTFGIRMVIPGPNNIRQLSSEKHNCNEAMTSPPYFLCTTSNCARLTLPRSGCRQHHSSGDHMITVALYNAIPSSLRNQGLHTMFFAGRVCTIQGDIHIDNASGQGSLRGNRSINSGNRGFTSIRILQHEWSHNYGAEDSHQDDPCQTACIMAVDWFNVRQEVYNVWCERCRLVILANRGLH